MKKSTYWFAGFVLAAFFIIGIENAAQAAFNISINFGAPRIVEAAPAEVVMMPRTGVYYVPGVNYDIFFYSGYWWFPRGNRWYMSRRYNGPWNVAQRNHVPAPLFRVPQDYRNVYQNERHINYGKWNNQNRNDQDRIKQNKINQDRINQEQINQNRIDNGQNKQSLINQNRIDQDQIKQNQIDKDRNSQDQNKLNKINQDRINQNQSDQNRINKDQADQNKINQDNINQNQINQNQNN